MRRLLVVLAIASSACAAKATVNPTPGTESVQSARVLAVRFADATTAGLKIANETGDFLDKMPLPTNVKDDYDCAIMKVTGVTSAPSATVTKVCGAVPLVADAPLPKALTELKAVASCPSLATTVSRLTAAVNPLIAKLDSSDQPALKVAGISLRATFAVLSIGGGTCQ